jgi:hypothetical protein
MKTIFQSVLMVSGLVVAVGLAAAQASFTLNRFVPYPGLGDYQIETVVNFSGGPPKQVSQLACIASIDPTLALQATTGPDALAQQLGCKKTILEDTETIAKVQTKCDATSSLMVLEKPSKDVLKITTTTGIGGAQAMSSVSTATWMRRPCSVKPAQTGAASPAPMPSVPKATAQQCKEMAASLAKLKEAGSGQMPAATYEQLLSVFQGSMKTQGCGANL